jgi:DNA replication licensing factor MCM6
LSGPAREYLVERYQFFRREDSVGVDKSAYRITVRQLESMVRLAEALAKLHLVKEVRKEY